jgi:minor extracellular serine protease Vpr
VALLAVLTALASALPAAAALQPVRRTFGETTLPRVRPGVIHAPAAHARGRVRVIVGLAMAPLAAEYGRTFSAAVAHRKLDVASATSRAYLARLVAAQRRDAAALRRAIPQAQIQERYRIVLDGMTVELPYTKLSTLVTLGFVRKVYGTTTYRMNTNRSPAVIGADVLHSTTGARGDGIKIGIVDDGVDPTNPFLSAKGFSYPAGFPEGNTKFTSPKVIVARAFPGPTSGKAGRLPVDRTASFHGTHVAGIAAGDANTCSPGGNDHPPTCGLSGVAPRAYLGNYRVFTVPTPIGHVANTPEIVAAFESAVADGMDVINFSGGGPETEPSNDPMVDTIRNTVAAGVVPVIAAGNDRDSFGLGTVGSPGTAPDAITVAAVSNTHVFAPTMAVHAADAPVDLTAIPIESAAGHYFPDVFALQAHDIVDVGAASDPRLCGPSSDPNNERLTPLAPGSLTGKIALVSRGHCTFASKGIRAQRAGASGVILVDNRPGEAEPVPVELAIPAGKISDLDGARLRSYLASHGGTAPVTIGHTIQQAETGRSGIVTDFSSAGLTDFQDMLKPDVSAPGGQILSSTLPEVTGGTPFAVFDGTSMATPHVTGSAALLIQLHPTWTPQQIKSALVSTAGASWADTARTQEAPVTLEGGGLVNLPRADEPQVFTDPATLSFRGLDVTHGGVSKALLVRVSDAGNGAGTWSVELEPQSATSGASLTLPPFVDVPPGGEGELVGIARASADAVSGEDYGFIVLRRGDVTRRIPYAFVVSKPALASMTPQKLTRFVTGDTRQGTSRVSVYCCPSEPFGPPPDYIGRPMNETGSEHLYVTSIDKPLVNTGVAVWASSDGAIVDPWFLGSKDEHNVQGYDGTPVNQNDLLPDYSLNIGAAGSAFPRLGQYYVAVDSGSDPFTNQPLPGSYVVRSWQNDLKPPAARILTTRVGTGRPTIVARVLDAKSGVDPLSLAIGYRGAVVGAALYDPFSGLALFPLPSAAPRIPAGRIRLELEASDFQESKNLETIGKNLLPNTTFKSVRLHAVRGPALTWLTPVRGACVPKSAPLAVIASSNRGVRSVRFTVNGRRVAVDHRGTAGLFTGTWHAAQARHGRHVLSAIATDAAGRRFAAQRPVRVCR